MLFNIKEWATAQIETTSFELFLNRNEIQCCQTLFQNSDYKYMLFEWFFFGGKIKYLDFLDLMFKKDLGTIMNLWQHVFSKCTTP